MAGRSAKQKGDIGRDSEKIGKDYDHIIKKVTEMEICQSYRRTYSTIYCDPFVPTIMTHRV